MSDLAEFLLARIAKDEAKAREAIDPERPGTHWHWVMDSNDTPVRQGHLEGAQEEQTISLRTVEETESRSGVGPLPHFVVHSLQDVHPGGGEHIARWDPARVLAECEAKRRIVESCRVDYEDSLTSGDDGTTLAEEVLHALALPYADHPDFRQEWRA